MNQALKCLGILLLGLCLSCQKPVILKMTNNEKDNYSCEFSIGSEISYDNIDSLKNDLKNDIYKSSRRCKCDTVYVDIDDLFNLRGKDPYALWGICK